MLGKRVGKGGSGLHFLVNGVQDRLERGVCHSLPQDIERLHERHAGFEQSGQLLIEDQEFLRPYASASPATDRQARKAAAPLQREDDQPLFVELAPKAGLVLGDINAFADNAAGRGQPTAKFHVYSLAYAGDARVSSLGRVASGYGPFSYFGST